MEKLFSYQIKPFLLTAFFLFWELSASSSSDSASFALFSIVKNGKKIGYVKAEMKNCAQGQKITLQSHLRGRLIFEINVVQFSECIMSGGFLFSCSTSQKINGNSSFNHGLLYKGNGYQNVGNEETEGPIPDKIVFLTTLLYFREPAGYREIYSETLKKMVSLSSPGKGIYRLNISEGRYTEYQYRGGQLYRVFSKSMLGEVVFQRT